MKKINLVFGVLLAASLCGNVYLWGAQQEQAGQLAEGNARLEELQRQSADRQAGQEELTAQIDAAQRNLTTAQQDAQTAREALQTAARPIPEQKPAPATESPAEKQSGAVVVKSANDLLNEAFGGGGSGSTPSKPSGGSSGGWEQGSVVNPGEDVLGGGGNVDDFNWD